MIIISKAEAKAVREIYPDAMITRTMKQKSKRGRYYMQEDRKHLSALKEARNQTKGLK